jgi:hypothetical protein
MSDRPYGAFTPGKYQTTIRRDADELLAALATADPAAPVRACRGSRPQGHHRLIASTSARGVSRR